MKIIDIDRCHAKSSIVWYISSALSRLSYFRRSSCNVKDEAASSRSVDKSDQASASV